MWTGRLERRTPLAVLLQVARTQTPGDVEMATTENVSARGARVLTRRPLLPDEQVLVTLRGGRIPFEARVVYCRPLPRGLFGVGLHFGRVPWSW